MGVQDTQCWNMGAFFFLCCLNENQTTEQVIHSKQVDSNKPGWGRRKKNNVVMKTTVLDINLEDERTTHLTFV